VLLATHTVCPVFELDEHEFTVFGVATVVTAPPVPMPLLVSIGTTSTPLGPAPHLPSGTYTVALLPATRTDMELEGRQASGASVGVAVGASDVGLGLGVGFGVAVRVGAGVWVGPGV